MSTLDPDLPLPASATPAEAKLWRAKRELLIREFARRLMEAHDLTGEQAHFRATEAMKFFDEKSNEEEE